MDENSQIFTQDDIEKNRVIAAIAYIPFLFFLPLITAKDSAFAKFHANQGLVLLISFAVVNIMYIIPILGAFIQALASLALVIIGILGAVGAYSGKADELPLIGQFNLINK